MEDCLCVDVANPDEWTGMEYSKAQNVPPESFFGIISILENENTDLINWDNNVAQRNVCKNIFIEYKKNKQFCCI